MRGESPPIQCPFLEETGATKHESCLPVELAHTWSSGDEIRRNSERSRPRQSVSIGRQLRPLPTYPSLHMVSAPSYADVKNARRT